MRLDDGQTSCPVWFLGICPEEVLLVRLGAVLHSTVLAIGCGGVTVAIAGELCLGGRALPLGRRLGDGGCGGRHIDCGSPVEEFRGSNEAGNQERLQLTP